MKLFRKVASLLIVTVMVIVIVFFGGMPTSVPEIIPAVSTAFAAPLPPSNLAAAVQPGPAVTLTWDDNSLNEVGFRVFRALAPGTDFVDLTGLGLPPNSVSFTDTTVTTGVTYSYRVVSFDLTGDSPPSNTVTITATIPALPTGLAATEQAGPPQTITLTWIDNADNEIGFRIDRADDTDFTLNLVENVVVANAVNFVDADIIPGNTYFYRVSALSTGGATAPSNVATITVSTAAGMVAGPVMPIAGFPIPNGYPLYYQDILGTKISMLPIGPENLADPPDPANPYSVAIGFGAEAFYYMAEATGVPGLAEFAIEAVWDNLNEAPVPGDEAVMNRVRLRLDVLVSGDYSVETPYGTFDFTGVVAGIPGPDINFTQDILGLGQDFNTVTTGPVNVFLRPTTAPPAGFLGNGAVGTVTGAPGQITSVTITGPGGVLATTDQWAIFGRLLSAPVTPSFLKNVNLATRTINVTDTSAGAPTNWLWDFGDGTTSIVQNPAHTYAAAGNFIVKLTAGNAGGTATASQMVSTFTQPSADFTTSFGATLFTLNFASSTAGNPTGWMWDFGDGTTSTLQNPSHVYTTAGAVTVTLSVFNPVGTATASQELIVGLPPLPTGVPAAPSGLMAWATALGQVSLTWVDNSDNEDSFDVTRAKDVDFTVELFIFEGLPVNSISFIDNTVDASTTYFYQIDAVNVIGDSLPSNTVSVTTVAEPPAPTNVDFDPDTLNLKSKGKFVTVYIELPPGDDVNNIDISTVILNGVVPALDKPTQVGDYDNDDVPDLMVKFDRTAVQEILTPGDEVEIIITGEVAGDIFEASDIIRVIGK
jgi:PKD repeat protein